MAIYGRWGARAKPAPRYCSECGKGLGTTEEKCPACGQNPDEGLRFPTGPDFLADSNDESMFQSEQPSRRKQRQSRKKGLLGGSVSRGRYGPWPS
jgi:hypothetical protein